jgi:predicted AAA+ superfamily ATPase
MADQVAPEQFIEIALDRVSHMAYRNPKQLYEFILAQTRDEQRQYYVMIDEIQLSYKVKNSDVEEAQVADEDREMLYTTFYDVLNDLMSRPNLDIYVTGSNSKMLSKDIVTNFRDRGTEIRVYPLSFQEYLSYSGLDKGDALEQYLMYGGMPLAVLEAEEAEKRKYLQGLFANVYLKDIVERYKLNDDEVLSALVSALASSVGSLTNPHKLATTAATLMDKSTSDHTIKNYLDYLEDAFLFSSAKRYDVKGRKYFSTIQKYYAVDLGLRNAQLNFRQQERSHLMENMIYNELIRRGYSVDVGVVEVAQMIEGKRKQSQYEIDFVVNVGSEKVYIQSALNVDTPEKKAQETFSLHNTADFYRKIVVLDGNQKPWTDEDGVCYVGVIPFLLQDCLRH